MKPYQIWFGLALNPQNRTINLATIQESKEKAELSTKQQFPDSPILVFVLTDTPDLKNIYNKVKFWLIDNNVEEPEEHVKLIFETIYESMK